MNSFVKLEHDVSRAIRDLNHLERERFPMAYTWALTRTAQDCADAVKTVTRNNFDLHTDFIPRGIRVQSANVRDLRDFGIAESAVFTAPIISGWMPLHETGGMKTPRKRDIAIPSDKLQSDAFKTSTGKIKSAWQPKKLLQTYNALKNKKPIRISKNRRVQAPFILKTKGGQSMIVRRLTTARKPLEILYILEPKARIHQEWDFEKTVRKIADFRFYPNFKNAFTAVSLLSRP